MDRELSISLDLTRAVAAFSVFLAHFSYMGYTGTYTDFFHEYGHSGVVMFFVLSGYVIAFVCENKHSDFRCYMTARFARLYSVLLFALLLTFVLDTTGRSLDPSTYSGIPDSSPFAGAIINVLFLQQSSLFSFKYFSNGPLWSLSYEFWYYVIFGCYFYLRGYARYLSIAALSLVVWPNILLLMPCWLTGVFVYQLHKRGSGKSRKYTLLAGLSFALFWFIASQAEFITWLSHFPETFGVNRTALGFSKYFLSDYLLAAVFGVMIFSLKYASGLGILSGTISSKAIRLSAGFSFSIYSYHVPVILFLSATGIFNTASAASAFLLMCTAIAAIYLLSLFTESKARQLRLAIDRLGRFCLRPNMQT
jgi:peptidoglycan/LPS O-acetylase OafA/YrhL